MSSAHFTLPVSAAVTAVAFVVALAGLFCLKSVSATD